MAKVKRLEERFNEERVFSEVAYEDQNAKVVRFYLKGGQEVKPHTSPSSVFISVLKGKLTFICPDEEVTLTAGDSIFYEPKEIHGFKALEDSVVEATISPNPSIRRSLSL